MQTIRLNYILLITDLLVLNSQNFRVSKDTFCTIIFIRYICWAWTSRLAAIFYQLLGKYDLIICLPLFLLRHQLMGYLFLLFYIVCLFFSFLNFSLYFGFCQFYYAQPKCSSIVFTLLEVSNISWLHDLMFCKSRKINSCYLFKYWSSHSFSAIILGF